MAVRTKEEATPLTIATRPATPADYPTIRTLLEAAFKDDESALWEHLVAHDRALTAESVRLALTPEGRVAACTVVLPRTVQGPQGPVAGAVITLVACQPDLQNQGYGGATVRDALAYMAAQGLAVGVLYGHPPYYPHFGFAPVLAAVRTHLAVVGAGPVAPPLAPATEGDLPLVGELYAQQLRRYPCAVGRGPEPWLWQPRNPGRATLLRLAGEAAYAFVAENREQELLFVHEAAADGARATGLLLDALVAEAHQRGLKEVRLATPRSHPLSRLAQLRGAEQRLHPARAGMAAVVDWSPLLPPGYGVVAEGLALGGQLVLRVARLPLTQLVLGYRTVDDLLLSGEAALLGDAAVLRRAFPAREPHWFLAPHWH